MALASIFLVLADSGLFLHQSRTFPSLIKPEDISRFMADGFSLRFGLGVISGVVLITVGLVSGKGEATTNFIGLLAISILLSNLMGGYSSYLYGMERFGFYGILSWGTQIITTCFGFFALYANLGLTGIGWAQVIGSLIALLIIRAVIRNKIGVRFNLEISPKIISLYKQSFPLGIVAIIIVFYNRANFTLVSFFLGDNAAGIYNAAFALINGIALLASTFTTILLPRFSLLWNSDYQTLKNLYSAAFRYLLIIGMGIAFGLIVLARPIISAIFSDKYVESAQPLLILSFTGIFLFLNSLQQVLMMARNANGKLIRMVVISSGSNLITALILIPDIGYNGAAIAMLSGEVLGFVYGLIVNKDLLYIGKYGIFVIQSLAASVPMLIVIKCFNIVPLVFSVVTAIAVYFSILIIVGGLTKSDLAILVGAFKK
jgi:O-antigen/teichoic acid export membrane protein